MRILLLLPTTSYRADAFLAAAARLGVVAAVASDRCHVLAEVWPAVGDFPIERSLALDFRDPQSAAAEIVRAAGERSFDAIIPTSDETQVIAALASRTLGLPHNAPDAAYAARNKARMRERLRSAGVRCPSFEVFAVDQAPSAPACGFPCVVKPLLLSGSRGVIRADDAPGFAAAVARVARLLARPDVAPGDDPARREILVEAFVPGVEVALEGLLAQGRLEVLALFDKPDPLDGPFFEETIYLTPSRLPEAAQASIAAAAAAAAAAIGLTEGPIHAELRWSVTGPSVIEVAARSIGGLCGRTLRFAVAGGEVESLEERVLRRALALDGGEWSRPAGASGVMMVPIPRAGVLQAIDGEAAARAVAGIEEVTITARIGETLVPLPEGASYLGFLFARGAQPAEVEAALREAHRRLSFTVAALL